LAYWLYETTLVYVIYKAWLPLAHVAWEYNPKHDKASTKLPRPDESPQGKKPAKGPGTVDLAVLNKQGTQKWLFEAKWWRSSKDTALVARDAGKLGDRRFGKKVNGRFLLTFWYSWQEKRWTGKYPTGEIAFLQRLPRRLAIKAKPVFLGAFPADCRWEKKKLGDRYKPYFAMAVLEVNGAKKKRSRGA